MFSKSELMKALKSKFVSKANNLQDILDNIDFDNHDPTNLFNNLNNQLSEIVYDSDFTDIKFSSSNNYSLVHSTRGNCVYLKHHYDFEDHEIDKVYDIHDHPLVLNFGISSSKNIYTEFLYTNLSHFINSSKGAYFSNTQKAIIALEIALALQFAHRKGVIHGQLIPETIWLDDRGKVKLDFTKEKLDIFLIGSQLTFFFAPNIIKGDKPTEKDDIYSFGTILYALNSMTVPIITKYEEPRNIPITGNSTMQNIITQCLKDNPTSRISLDEIIQIMIDSDFQIFDNVDSIFVLERYRKIRKFEKSLTA
ncbi:hypothetical protein TRFO_41855 [Tritrichomonas foetus]|uniref:Protein kinase domain-containing protein n=1 Tax=Tritrichomonas foetus TaxID=1144522 RepID=A0A1J4L307_9EUKA|nr:hypothetical protein TRFO_41855 [Tritrichomonas foetus]|eukprot:OHT16334.1 hypothetical protein TRFO_41855 [Tritrichomonas foetus]